MAYHKADNERWRQLDFVLGYEVQVSGTNPNVCPLCEELAGKYPKGFEFVGWPPPTAGATPCRLWRTSTASKPAKS